MKALVERYIADGQPVGSAGHCQKRVRPGVVACHHPQCDVGPGRPGSDCQPPTLQRGAHPHGAGLPFVCRHHAHRPAAARHRHRAGRQARAAWQPDQPQKRARPMRRNLLSNLSAVCGRRDCTHARTSRRSGTLSFLRLSEKRLLVIIVSPDDATYKTVLIYHRPWTIRPKPVGWKPPTTSTAHYMAAWTIDQVREKPAKRRWNRAARRNRRP